MSKSLRIYRPNKNNNGFCAEFQLAYKENEKFDKYMAFLTMAKQVPSDNENAAFDWNKEGVLTVKLGENDLGEMLAFFNRDQDALGYNKKGLYHESEKGNKVISLNGHDNGVYLKISYQSKDKTVSDSRSISLSYSDCNIIKVLLENAISKIYGW